MTNASTAANFTRRTNAAAAVNKPLPAFRARKRNARSTSSEPGRHESHNLAETRAKDIGMEAFEKMFAASRPKFVATAQAILRNREDAEDAVQNAFLSAYRNLRTFEGRATLTTWFTRIVLNAALMIRRRRKSSWTPLQETTTADDAKWMERITDSEPDPEAVYAERETLQVINQMLAKMKPGLRQAFTMTYYDEMSNREASASLGVPTGTFKARLYRARRYLASHAQHSLAAPIPKSPRSSFLPSVKADFQLLATTATHIFSLGATFS